MSFKRPIINWLWTDKPNLKQLLQQIDDANAMIRNIQVWQEEMIRLFRIKMTDEGRFE